MKKKKSFFVRLACRITAERQAGRYYRGGYDNVQYCFDLLNCIARESRTVLAEGCEWYMRVRYNNIYIESFEDDESCARSGHDYTKNGYGGSGGGQKPTKL